MCNFNIRLQSGGRVFGGRATLYNITPPSPPSSASCSPCRWRQNRWPCCPGGRTPTTSAWCCRSCDSTWWWKRTTGSPSHRRARCTTTEAPGALSLSHTHTHTHTHTHAHTRTHTHTHAHTRTHAKRHTRRESLTFYTDSCYPRLSTLLPPLEPLIGQRERCRWTRPPNPVPSHPWKLTKQTQHYETKILYILILLFFYYLCVLHTDCKITMSRLGVSIMCVCTLDYSCQVRTVSACYMGYCGQGFESTRTATQKYYYNPDWNVDVDC